MNLPSGWAIDIDDELGTVYVHLASEVGIQQDPEHGDWVAAFDDELAGPWPDPQSGVDYVEREYNANPRHALEW
jgi:hypothetical protein